MTDEYALKTLRGALSNALCNASNFPPKASPHLLGQDMTPLIDATVDAILHWLASHDREVSAKAWDEGNEMYDWAPNPYRGETNGD